MNLELLKTEIEAHVPGCMLEIIPNPSPSAQHSLLIGPEHALAIATFLRDAPHLRLDYCSNVTGVDWLPPAPAKPKATAAVDPVEEVVENVEPPTGHFEVVYHLYSMELKHGPVILRMRTEDRDTRVHLPSLISVWRSTDFQEREIFDLFGVIFDGHPDLRRILMWDEFTDFPMRRDYVEPDDYEYEPTPHNKVLLKTTQHHGGAA
ncbi:MAG: NADH-quinone oxidoreductase subunit C [Bryocella sp.]